MKKVLFLTALLAGGLGATAADYPYLTFQTTDGEEKSLAVEELVIALSDGRLLATNASGTQAFELSELSKMYFSTTASAVQGIEREFVTLERGAEVYDLSGRRVAAAPLRRGVYVVKQNGKTRKVMMK